MNDISDNYRWFLYKIEPETKDYDFENLEKYFMSFYNTRGDITHAINMRGIKCRFKYQVTRDINEKSYVFGYSNRNV